MSDTEPSVTERSLIAAKGGAARAESLTPERKKEIAKAASEARWAKQSAPIATHEGVIMLGDCVIPCHVLDDGTRMLTQRGFLEALGRHPKASVRSRYKEDRVAPILYGNALKPFISRELAAKTQPITFRTRAGYAKGYRADALPGVCEMYLKARDAGVLNKNQEHIGTQADILMRALAHVGIIALVDEATGYQDQRAGDALARILEAFVAKELRKWVATFPSNYFKELCRLRGWAFKENYRLPRFAGKLTDDLVYKRLAPGVRDELQRVNPVVDGKRRGKHHQWLTPDVGNPKLQEHLSALTALMRACDDWHTFERMVDRALPRQPHIPLFDNIWPKED